LGHKCPKTWGCVIAAKIQLRNDTEANWTIIDPILAQGEMGIENDTLMFKVGDGASLWSALSYGIGRFMTGQEILDNLTTVDGTGSGLDADFLDGIEGSAYARGEIGGVAVTDTRNDTDVLPNAFTDKHCHFDFTNQISGSPNAWDSVITMRGWDADYAAWQLIGAATNTEPIDNRLYFRTGSTVWGALQEVWHSGSPNITCTGNVTAYFSDERLKDIGSPIQNALDLIGTWRAVHYTCNDTAAELGYDKSKAEIGLITQDIELDFPELIQDAPINGDKGTDYKTLDYGRVTAVLVAALQDQIEINKSLEERLTNLENLCQTF
jgi:hypothetical protein